MRKPYIPENEEASQQTAAYAYEIVVYDAEWILKNSIYHARAHSKLRATLREVGSFLIDGLTAYGKAMAAVPDTSLSGTAPPAAFSDYDNTP